MTEREAQQEAASVNLALFPLVFIGGGALLDDVTLLAVFAICISLSCNW